MRVMIPSLNKEGAQALGDVEKRLAAAGHRITEPRRAVLSFIAAQGGPFTAADVIETFKAVPSVGRATVFRTLELLTELQILEKVHREASGASGYSYVLCGLTDTHHHHTVCTRCGAVSDLEGCFLDIERVHGLSAESSFRVEAHHLELYGTCEKCQREVANRPGEVPVGGNK